MSEHSYHKLYDRLVDEVKTLYYANQVRIHKGLWALIISTVLFLTIMFITNGSKVIFLLMWIATMFAVAAYLIAVEYLNFELKRKVEEITRREQDFGEETADIVVRQRRLHLGVLGVGGAVRLLGGPLAVQLAEHAEVGHAEGQKQDDEQTQGHSARRLPSPTMR